jgi:hypothetical protein
MSDKFNRYVPMMIGYIYKTKKSVVWFHSCHIEGIYGAIFPRFSSVSPWEILHELGTK